MSDADAGSILEPEALGVFSEAARRALYEVIELRRDVRHFQADTPLDPAVLDRILAAAHQAPSVGFSQPWGFVLIRERETRTRIRQSFLRCRAAEAARFPEPRRQAYLSHRLEGILEAALNLCVVVDLRSNGEAILGTTVQPEAVRASAYCAVQNLWLAARAEGVGVGWVSIVEPAVLRRELGLPRGVEPMAYLCVGYPVAFRKRPMLEETGWGPRRPLNDAIHPDGHWVERRAPSPAPDPSEHDAQAAAAAAALLITEGSGGTTSPAVASVATARREIVAASHAAGEAARVYQLELTKPAGSLGRLEELGCFYARARGSFPAPAFERATLAVFAADHGVAEEGVSAYGSPVTAAMVCNVMAGGAAICALAAASDLGIHLVDVGVSGDLSSAPLAPRVALRRCALRAGSANFLQGPALTPQDFAHALAVGEAVAAELAQAGVSAIGVGEIGIANTTAAAALSAALTQSSAAQVVGRGTGLDSAGLRHKLEIVERALALHAGPARSVPELLCRLGGFEIVSLVGCILGAARARLPVVLDGFVTNVAALCAVRLEPQVSGYLLASHLSVEPGAAIVLEALQLAPLFDLGLRLGEGTGAALALPLLRAGAYTLASMATFATAGIVPASP